MKRGIFASVVIASLALPAFVSAAQPPLDLGTKHASEVGAPNYAKAAVTYADGALESFFRRAPHGVSYLRLRSNATEVVKAGFMIESIHMTSK